MIKENQRYLNKLLVLIDSIILLLSIKISWLIRFQTLFLGNKHENFPLQQYFIPLAFMIPIYIALYSIFRLYMPYRFKTLISESMNILKASIIGILIFIMILYIIKEIDYSRYLILTYFIISTLMMIVERIAIRFILRHIRRKGYNQKHVLFIGLNDVTLEFINRIVYNRHWGYTIEGILDDHINDVYSDLNGQYWDTCEIAAALEKCNKITGNINRLEEYLRKPFIDEVFITLPFKEYDKLNNVIETCEKYGVKAQIIPEFSKFLSSKPYIEDIEGTAVIGMRYIPLDSMINKIIKRVFDVVCSLIAIIIFSPVMIATTIIIKATSPGPIIFRQERVGLNKKTFDMYKFRSMKVQKESEEKVQWTTKNDPRKTKFGSFIRKTSIDELPQLFNVLKGDMSLVGPRPERPFFVDKFKEEIPKYMVKHQVRPGITGWAQVNGWRGDTSIEKRIQCDIYYIEHWNFWLDIKIMFLTVFKGFVNKNAY
ncbi:undecaprenyl-phosphate glucose phosphotransferase [Clostridium sp. CX1]|uniref:undecaprenyl-phosphate glucose phosphotransferase n=1 Tax=Clostridium sp. CX1 TaxID=2978346 RepID=UPI0021C0303D|nr:undecaprenyl-phosphate glucose phosphotransferase [Clostridium sp. CX1]MCT8978541.1 undecaprenyl-phosphate glucose phosphotransferase [Clostridium sp. CX1]